MSKDSLDVIEQLYIEFYDNMFSYAIAVLKCPSHAEDAVQESFYEAIRKIETLKVHPNQPAWLMTTLKRKIHEIRRKHTDNNRLVSLETQDELYDHTAADMDTQIVLKEFNLQQIKAALTEAEFHLLTRLYIDGVSIETVAQELGISPAACYKRHSRLRTKLRQSFSHIFSD